MKIAKIFFPCSVILMTCISFKVAHAQINCNGGNYDRSVCGNIEKYYNIPRDSPNAPFWKLNKHYNMGDVVVFNDEKYQCKQAHTPHALDWKPPQTPALWEAL